MVPGFAAYSASKFALEALADAYRFELAPLGIDSIIVEPGLHRTPMLERIFVPANQNRPEVVVQAFVHLTETPAGERPFRTVPTTAIQQLLEPYNVLAETIRDVIARTFKAPELAVFQQAGSTGV